MGVQAIRGVLDPKLTTAFTTPATTAAVFPGADECSVVTMLAAADTHRLGEIQRQVENCINFARDEDLFDSAGSVCVLVKLDEPKASIRTEALAASVVTGDVGIMIVGSERAKGSRNILENAHKQVLDFMNEQDRLAA